MASQLKLLELDPDRIPSVAEKIWGPTLCATIGFGLACFVNWGLRKPVFSGVQKHVAFTGVGAVLGQYMEKKRDAYLAERDAVLRRYVELHPEDFPQLERKTFGDVLQPWIPVR